MDIEKTFIEDLIILTPSVFEDTRGSFFESFNSNTFRDLGVNFQFVQDNQSFSKKGTIRGLHYQNPPFAQTKLVRVLQGQIMDVAVDLRKDSPTYGKSFSVILSDTNRKQLLVPQGFAHGFSVLSDTASVLYKCDQFYNKIAEGGIKFDDPSLHIDWGIDIEKAIVSEKDRILPFMGECNSEF
ncbi:dTDP-4-dehydrorhamnose 3,5-epimerase [Flavobacterium sp. FlaQc-52]|jgi:dTDP-4-dehydrorhamnose 3,5-epimerase|uniref:dTDP-4-dehydrorhamnose 3,5-epimerase n=1 Tax=Flavobacterium sp. FlaQc-52 TaxID=3374185 RepID=UPI00375772F4